MRTTILIALLVAVATVALPKPPATGYGIPAVADELRSPPCTGDAFEMRETVVASAAHAAAAVMRSRQGSTTTTEPTRSRAQG